MLLQVASELGHIHPGDCLNFMRGLDDGSIDLVFADPPFNIGYEYDEYQDCQDANTYVDWCVEWMMEIQRVLKPNGTFWLSIGDEYAAELKVAAQKEVGFRTRSWVVWYYTFGVNCTRKFSRSHAHLFHFVKDESDFTFNADDAGIRVPSARASSTLINVPIRLGGFPTIPGLCALLPMIRGSFGRRICRTALSRPTTLGISRELQARLQSGKASMVARCRNNYWDASYALAAIRERWF